MISGNQYDSYHEAFLQERENWIKYGNGYLTIIELIERWDRAQEFVLHRWMADTDFECAECGVTFRPLTEDLFRIGDATIQCGKCEARAD